jgi:threonine aldolase
MTEIVDLRSDTVTRPTPAMIDAMASAEVGDDVYGEDPTINRLQEMAASRMGKEAGLFVTSGTMGNLLAILTHCGRGDEVIMGNLAHTFLFEGGGVAALGGVHTYTLPNQSDGTLKLEDIRTAIRTDDPHFPITRLVVLENTHNRCGGTVLPLEYMRKVGELVIEKQLLLHLDGARLFNAAAALGVSAADLSEAADSVSFCLSKGLCAPVGSVLCGSKEFIKKARRLRKMLGGGMRQAGILAAAGIVGLEQMITRLSEDHRRAGLLAEGLINIPGLKLRTEVPPTNMVFVTLDEHILITAPQVVENLNEFNIWVGVVGPRQFRMVTHYWIDDDAVMRTIDAFRRAI